MGEYDFKIQNLLIMLEWEENQPEDKKYGANITHWSGKCKPVNIDEGAIQCLIEYYQFKDDCN